jgi:hypothetical protein
MELVGPKQIIANIMSKNDNKRSKKDKTKQVIELLKFALSLDDEEVMKSTVESVIEILEEEISQ